MSAYPLVSVVLPCFDAEQCVAEALESLLQQTYPNLELLAIDDGSGDSTARILRAYAVRDSRIRILSNPTNQGLIASLNRGVREAEGELIARMDSDDVAAPRRIERQVAVLRAQPEIGVVGTAIRLVSRDGRPIRPRPVRCVTPSGARFMALFATPLAHSTLMSRASVMKQHPYGVSPNSLHTEDYELFTRLLAAGVNFLNLDEPLVTVRIGPGGISLRFEYVQIRNFLICSRRHFERTLGRTPPAGPHRVLINRMDRTTSPRDLVYGLRLLDRIEAVFLARESASAREVRAIAAMQRCDILIQAGLKGPMAVRVAAGLLAAYYMDRLLAPPARRYLRQKLESQQP